MTRPASPRPRPGRRAVPVRGWAAGSVVLGLVVAGCGTTVSGAAAPAPAPAPAAPAASSAPSAPSATAPDPSTTGGPPPPASPSADPDRDPRFGDAFEWAGGITVGVSPPVTDFVPSDTSSADPAAAYLGFAVVVRNDGTTAYDDLLSLSLDSGGVEADRLFDSAQGIDATPSDPLPPGQERVFRVAFGVADPNDLEMEVQPGFDYEEITFTLG